MDAQINIASSEYSVSNCSLQEAQDLVMEFHYSKGGSISAIYTHGLYRKVDNKLMGVTWWIPPTKDTALTVNATQWRKVLNLSRLVIRPEAPRNSASFLLGGSIRMIKKSKVYHSLITFADEAQGHLGGIYKATNWLYLGRVGPHARWVDPKRENRQVSNAHKNTTLMYSLGYIQLKKFYKHKYIMHLLKEKETQGENKMQLKNLVIPLSEMTIEQLEKQLTELRHRREVERPAGKARIAKAVKKEKKKVLTATEKMIANLSSEELTQLLKDLG